MKEVAIAIVGLGRVDSLFLKKMTGQKDKRTRIVGLVEVRPGAPGVKIAGKENIKIYPEIKDLVQLGDSVDVIFDLTGSIEARRALRNGMADSNNRHTVVAQEVMAFLMWDLIASGEAFPEKHALQRY